jgi:hypothetical protein
MQAILGLTIGARAIDASPPPALEVHSWENAKASETRLHLAPGASTDFWTSNGLHYRFDGQPLGELSFKTTAAREVEQVFSDGRGGLLTISHTDNGPALSRHDQDGRELWTRPIGRTTKPRTTSAIPNEIVGATIAAIDSHGTIYVHGWLQGCVDLSGTGRQRVCATRRNSGIATGPEIDTYPKVLFVNQYDAQGTWSRGLTFERMRNGPVAVSGSGLIATAGTWTAGESLDLRAPNGQRVWRWVPRRQLTAPLRSLVALFQPDGRPLEVTELDAAEYAVVRSQVFDSDEGLWLFVESDPLLTLSQQGRSKLTVPGGHCLAILSRARLGDGWARRFVQCAQPNQQDPFPLISSATAASDRRLILTNLPAALAAGEELGPIDGPRIPTTAQRLSLMVLREGQPHWHVQTSGVHHAAGLADGWVCFTQLQRISCIRPARKS